MPGVRQVVTAVADCGGMGILGLRRNRPTGPEWRTADMTRETPTMFWLRQCFINISSIGCQNTSDWNPVCFVHAVRQGRICILIAV